MAAAPQPTIGSKLRDAADRLYALSELADLPRRGILDTQRLHDGVEIVAGDLRASVRGRR